MAQFLLHSVNALVCIPSTVNDISFLECAFQVKYGKDSLNATLSLRFGFADNETFILLYHAHNLVPTTTQCGANTRSLSSLEQKYVARGGFPDIRLLSLHLKEPCPIVCNSAFRGTSSETSSKTWQCFVDLTKSTEVEIAFDWKWVPREHRGPFLHVISQPEHFHGFHIDVNNLKGQHRRLEDWTVFHPGVDNVIASSDPPSYTDTVHKRRWQISTGISQSPPAKRMLLTIPGSPTEKATTASLFDSPKPTSTTIDELECTTSPCSAQSPFRSPPGEKWQLPRRSADVKLESDLESTIRRIALETLSALLASPTYRRSSYSASQTTSASSINPDVMPTFPTSIRTSRKLQKHLSAQAAALAEKKLNEIFEDIEYGANCLRQAADEEFLASVAEEKLDIMQRKDDAMNDLQAGAEQLINEKLTALDHNDTIEELIEKALELAEEKFEDAFRNTVDKAITQAVKRIDTEIDTRAAKYSNPAWVEAVEDELLCEDAPKLKRPMRNGHAAGYRKRKFAKLVHGRRNT